MRQLFFKIFLSVLLTVLLTFAIGMVIAFWVMPEPSFPPGGPGPNRGPGQGPPPRHVEGDPGRDRPREFDERRPPKPPSEHEGPGGPWHNGVRKIITMHASTLRYALHDDGPDAALALNDELTEMWSVQTYVVDEDGKELQARDVPPALLNLIHATNSTGLKQFGEADQTIIYAERMQGKDGREYVFAAQTQPLNDRGGPPFARILVTHLTPVAIGLGLVCFLLARYIAGPIVRLRTALRGFAEGDMKQRVGASIGERRDEIGELARDFDNMAERIATLLGAQRRLLQDISHELRSPLARQRVALELIRQHSGGDAERAIDRAELEAERLDELIGELLTLTRLESRTDGAEPTRVDLADLVREVIENAEFEACNDKRSVQLVACMPCTAHVVPELMQRAVENVVRNALAYTADGTNVEVSLLTDVSGAIIRVRDHGPGVPPKELEDIFRPFYRVGHARDRQSGGVGLGLAIVARAVASNGGEVVANNHPDGGLVIEIRLPMEANENA